MVNLIEVIGARGISQYAQGRSIIWTFSAPSTGAGEYEIPAPLDGNGNSVAWSVLKAGVRVSTPASGSTSFQLQVSSSSGSFQASSILSSTLSISGTGTYEASTTSFARSTVNSGDRIRVNLSAVDPTHDGIVITLELGYVT